MDASSALRKVTITAQDPEGIGLVTFHGYFQHISYTLFRCPSVRDEASTPPRKELCGRGDLSFRLFEEIKHTYIICCLCLRMIQTDKLEQLCGV